MRTHLRSVFLLCLALLSTSSCAPAFGPCASKPVAAVEARGPLHLFAFGCGVDRYYLADYEPGSPTATLHAPDGSHTLTQQIAASGAKYAGGRYLLWTKGRDFMLEVDGQLVEGCTVSLQQEGLERSWAAGYHFLAFGNEPNWNLLTGPGGTLVKACYGEYEHRFPGIPIESLRNGAMILREADGHILRLRTSATPCLDDMMGYPGTMSVEFELDGKKLNGCGILLH